MRLCLDVAILGANRSCSRNPTTLSGSRTGVTPPSANANAYSKGGGQED